MRHPFKYDLVQNKIGAIQQTESTQLSMQDGLLHEIRKFGGYKGKYAK
jgi:hypothetical protein